jgi:TPP-dependent pyruvate/acetoin dehydrogenase alpha subunit
MSTEKQSTSETYTITKPGGLDLDTRAYLEIYSFMKLTRMVDEKLNALYKQNRIVGGLYSGLGQEAVSVGSACALERDDYVAPMIRNMGTMFVRGFTAFDLFLQYLAKGAGPSGGKDNTLHFGSLDRKVIAPISLLGDMIPIMTGIAFTLKIKNIPNIAMTYIGDGGSSTGAFHEGLNLASVRKVPLVLCLENNGFAFSTPVSRQSKLKDFANKAKAYGIYGEVVDGNNVLQVLDACRRARERCLGGEGPVLIECKTFRRRGHAAYDDASYVPAGVRAEWERKDPIEAFTRFLTGKAVATAAQLEEIDTKLAEDVEASLQKAIDSPYPKPEDALRRVYYEPGPAPRRS